MVGILLLSHGKMAEGLLDTCKLFFGDELNQVEARCLERETSPEDFDKQIEDGIAKVDTGSGCIIFCDLFGGTPSNRCIRMMSDRHPVITGMNLAVLLEFLGNRLSINDISEVDVDSLLETGKDGILSLNSIFKNVNIGG